MKEPLYSFHLIHILSDVQDIADRTAIIDKGRILKIGKTHELTTDLLQNYIYEIEFFDEFKDHTLFKPYNQIHHIEQPTSKKIRIHINKDADLKSLTNEIIKQLLHRNYNIQNFFRFTPNLDDVYLKYIKERKSL
jgi:ABC-type multidrug transport system ATPase subunit